MVFERGYKTWCERFSEEIRQTLELDAHAPLDAHALARHMKIRVWTPREVPGLNEDTITVLLRSDGTPSCWSAVTIMAGTKILVILNSSHSPARQCSDLAHELAHRIRQHEAQEVSITEDGLMLLHSYDKMQELEADWLAACLLLPREALLYIKESGLDEGEAAKLYGVSPQMLRYRLDASGVNRQIGRRRNNAGA